MNNFKSLEVYRKAYTLAVEVAKEIKDSKNYRLKGQLFGSITSVPANLAEMTAFDSIPQIKHKIKIAVGECNESEMWLDLLKDTEEITQEKYDNFLGKNIEVRRMLLGFLRSMK